MRSGVHGRRRRLASVLGVWLFAVHVPLSGASGLAMAQAGAARTSPPMVPIDHLYDAFDATGVTGIAFGDPVVLATYPVGNLVLPTGRMVAGDPFFLDWTAPEASAITSG